MAEEILQTTVDTTCLINIIIPEADGVAKKVSFKNTHNPRRFHSFEATLTLEFMCHLRTYSATQYEIIEKTL